MTPLKAIRAKCLDCCCGQAGEVRLCEVQSCPLYEFRMGHGPKQNITDEERARRASLMKNLVKNMGKTALNP